MEIVFHSHRAISDYMRRRAERGIEKLARRLTRAVAAIVRFEEDGRMRRVEIVLHAPRNRKLITEGTSKFFGPALAAALARMESRTNHVKRPPKARSRRLPRG